MKIALVQLDLAWEDVAENHARAATGLREAAAGGARLAILPEMFSTGFSMDSQRLAESPGGTSESFLLRCARDLDLWIIGSIPEIGEPHPRNMALVVSPAGGVTRYAKIHPFSLAGEDRAYSAGGGIVSLAIEGLRVTPFICYDLRFPEPFRLAAQETDLFVVIANWPVARRGHWQTLLRARAIENQAYVAGVNRVGEGGGLVYAGDSALVSPLGDTLAEAGDTPGVLIGEVDPARVRKTRAEFPFLQDRRPEAYKLL